MSVVSEVRVKDLERNVNIRKDLTMMSCRNYSVSGWMRMGHIGKTYSSKQKGWNCFKNSQDEHIYYTDYQLQFRRRKGRQQGGKYGYSI